MGRKATTPASRPAAAAAAGPAPEHSTTGIAAVAGSAARARVTASPSSPGIWTSSTTRSGRSRRTSARAASPRAAASTV